MSSSALAESRDTAAPMSHRQVLQALTGLLLGMFVALLSSTVVSSSLSRIVGELGGTQATYTWVVTATLLATTVSTPIWGKLADLVDRKLLVQLALVLFVIGSAVAGVAQDPAQLIGARVLQGLGAGGLTALVQVIMSDIISPRDRGRYTGLMGAVMGVAIGGGPLLGGVITDGIGWRWNFSVAVPFAVAAIIVIQRTLHLPPRRRAVTIDYLGAALITGGISLLLIWISLAGDVFAWSSAASYLMVGGSVVLLALAVLVESKAAEPIIPLGLFRNRTFTLVVVASIAVGVAMYGTSVFLSQYLQLGRGATPTESGLMTLPQVAAMLVASTVAGALISRTGRWKRWLIIGSILLAAGMALMGTIGYDTELGLVWVYMALLGLGVGMVMQNLVLVVQNSVDVRQMGAASAGVAFFRSLGGTIGVTVLGSLLGTRVADDIAGGLATANPTASDLAALSGGSLPSLDTLSKSVRTVVESAYGHGVAEIFLLGAPLALVTLLAVAFLPNRALGTKTGVQQLAEVEVEVEGEGEAEGELLDRV